ncbi:MAG: Gmad2 immunoglobulin-like domain-containing protein [Nocardioidaceae bacterium]
MTRPADGHDHTEELLSAALHDEAALVQPDPGALQAIRNRTAAHHVSTRNRWIFGSLGTGLATAAVITTVVLVGGQGTTSGQPGPAGAPSVPPVSTQSTPQLTGTPPQAPETTGTATQQSTGTPKTPSNTGASTGLPPSIGAMHPGFYDPASKSPLTMYYVGKPDADGRVRLHTEPHTLQGPHVPPAGSPELQAVNEFLTSSPIDPDYARVWPAGVGVRSITTSGPVTESRLTTINLVGEVPLDAPTGVSDQAAAAAVQALARTAGATAGDRVALTYNGDKVQTALGVDLPVQVQTDYENRAPIQITSPVEGATVPASQPVKFGGRANVFEGNVNWQLLDSSGTVVKHGYAMAAQGTWAQFGHFLGKLSPGSYTIRCYEGSAKDGSMTYVDDKHFTVH